MLTALFLVACVVWSVWGRQAWADNKIIELTDRRAVPRHTWSENK